MIYLFYFFLFFAAFLIKVSFLNYWFPWVNIILILIVWFSLKYSDRLGIIVPVAFLIGLFVDAQSNYYLGLTPLVFLIIIIVTSLVARYFFPELKILAMLAFGLIAPVILRFSYWGLTNILFFSQGLKPQDLSSYFLDQRLFLEIIAVSLGLVLLYYIDDNKRKNKIYY